MDLKESKRKPINYWNKQKCAEEALKYDIRSDFYKNSGSAYAIALKNGWLDEICSHMKNIRKPQNFWTYEKCKEVASSCKSKKDFVKFYSSAYNVAYLNNWLDDICSHMKPLGNKYKRLIYIYEFNNKTIYIGLTGNSDRRHGEHLNVDSNSPVYKYILKSGLTPEYKILSEYLPIEDAIKLEIETIEKYKTDGYNLLNTKKGGELGGNNLYWVYEKCKEEALKYNNRSDFSNLSTGAYNSCIKFGWLDDVCSHMNTKKMNIRNFWTKEHCQEEALKYATLKDFQTLSKTAYSIALKKKWLNDITNHMIKLKKPYGYWNNKENCKIEASKYKNKYEFQKNSSSAYNASFENNWLKEFFE